MSQVDFYFDFSCPWSYLALVRLRDVAERNAATINFRPVSVHQVLATENPELQTSRLAMNPAKAAWQRHDLAVWARFWGLQLKLRDNWPFDATAAGTAMLLVDDKSNAMDFALAVFAAHFGAGKDVGDERVLADVAVATGLDRTAFLEGLKTPGAVERLAANTGELIRRGGFGTPSMFIGAELFFGNDRIPLVEWTLGPVGDAQFVIPGQHGKL